MAALVARTNITRQTAPLIATDLPVGQDFENPVQSIGKKYFA
jgi:hypothetical protein